MRSAADDEQFTQIGHELVDGIGAVIHGWLVDCVVRFRPDLFDEATALAADVAPEVMAQLRALVRRDLDDQVTTPLTVLRNAIRIPTAVLSAAGVAPVRRDPFDVTAFPEDLYGLTPAAFTDVDPSLGALGIRWGAAKAHVHLSRRRRR